MAVEAEGAEQFKLLIIFPSICYFPQDMYELERTVSLTAGVAFQSDPVMTHIKTVHHQVQVNSLN